MELRGEVWAAAGIEQGLTREPGTTLILQNPIDEYH